MRGAEPPSPVTVPMRVPLPAFSDELDESSAMLSVENTGVGVSSGSGVSVAVSASGASCGCSAGASGASAGAAPLSVISRPMGLLGVSSWDGSTEAAARRSTGSTAPTASGACPRAALLLVPPESEASGAVLSATLASTISACSSACSWRSSGLGLTSSPLSALTAPLSASPDAVSSTLTWLP